MIGNRWPCFELNVDSCYRYGLGGGDPDANGAPRVGPQSDHFFAFVAAPAHTMVLVASEPCFVRAQFTLN